MTRKEIKELLVLKEWTRGDLAERLGITRNTVDRWFVDTEGSRRHPSQLQCDQMRAWLTDARDEVRKQPA